MVEARDGRWSSSGLTSARRRGPPRAPAPRPVAGHHHDRRARGASRRHGKSKLPGLGVTVPFNREQGLRAAELGRVLEGTLVGADRQVGGHGTEAEHREHPDLPLRPVGHEDEDNVARPDPLLRKLGADPTGLAPECVAVEPPAAFVDHRRGPRPLPNETLETFRQRHPRPPSAFSIAASAVSVTLGNDHSRRRVHSSVLIDRPPSTCHAQRRVASRNPVVLPRTRGPRTSTPPIGAVGARVYRLSADASGSGRGTIPCPSMRHNRQSNLSAGRRAGGQRGPDSFSPPSPGFRGLGHRPLDRRMGGARGGARGRGAAGKVPCGRDRQANSPQQRSRGHARRIHHLAGLPRLQRRLAALPRRGSGRGGGEQRPRQHQPRGRGRGAGGHPPLAAGPGAGRSTGVAQRCHRRPGRDHRRTGHRGPALGGGDRGGRWRGVPPRHEVARASANRRRGWGDSSPHGRRDVGDPRGHASRRGAIRSFSSSES